jgi:hypothetical protein
VRTCSRDIGVGDAGQVLPFHRIEQLEAHLEAAVARAATEPSTSASAWRERQSAKLTPRGFRQRRVERRHLDRAEQAAALQVRAHDAADALRQRAFAGERHHRDRMRCAPAP